ncbi:hypothetical protein SteCoe_11233 [Stentor coeruleus]|uniref:Globin family profile domain-containing protein n=1 Tax=Stentor coeruleus TaxID=5963 RepID=A0A1R2CDN4_9CILI|nr:hypothetical protein SteCoe_11233 [Stentor coeruleus]
MNLFEKYGGADFWSDFLNAVYIRLTKSEFVHHHFSDKNISHIKEMLLGLLELTLVSNVEIPKSEMKEFHKNLRISGDEFDEWISIYRLTLDEFGLSESDCTHIVSILSSFREIIVYED